MDTEKIQAAIKTLKSLCSVIYGSRAHVNITAEQGVDFETALACMERQVPKTVNRDSIYRFSGKCPSCGVVCTDDEKYCKICLQALDWESEAEK
jgi:hypothetical protein